MKYLKLVLFVVISGCVSLTSSENKSFNSMTFNELQEKCKNHNSDYEDISKGLEEILSEIVKHKPQNCTHFNVINLIEKLIAGIMPCFPQEERPKKNGTEYKSIVKQITDKFCIHHELAQFESDNNHCLNKNDSINHCLVDNLRNVTTSKSEKHTFYDALFYALAMTHSDQECKFLYGMLKCLSEKFNQNCGSGIAFIGKILLEKLKSSLNCIK